MLGFLRSLVGRIRDRSALGATILCAAAMAWAPLATARLPPLGASSSSSRPPSETAAIAAVQGTDKAIEVVAANSAYIEVPVLLHPPRSQVACR